MTDPSTEPILLSRRDFFRSAAVVAGSAALGWKFPAQAETVSINKTERNFTTIAFWTGAGFADAAKLAPSSGSVVGRGAAITIHGHFVPLNKSRATIDAIDAHFATPHGDGFTYCPFHAWSASHNPALETRFFMPVSIDNSVSFSVEHTLRDGGRDKYLLAVHPEPGALGLHAGTYAVAAGAVDWRQFKMAHDAKGKSVIRRSHGADVPADFEYVLVTIAEA